jgi:hypothetical protein
MVVAEKIGVAQGRRTAGFQLSRVRMEEAEEAALEDLRGCVRLRAWRLTRTKGGAERRGRRRACGGDEDQRARACLAEVETRWSENLTEEHDGEPERSGVRGKINLRR